MFLSPILQRNTTDCIPLADRGKTGYHFYKNHRIMSPMSDVRRDAPAAGLIHRVLPMQLPVRILPRDPSLHLRGFPE